jgi:hypothetical protein
MNRRSPTRSLLICLLTLVIIMIFTSCMVKKRSLPPYSLETCVKSKNHVNVAFVIIASPKGTNDFYDFCYNSWVKFSNKNRCKCIFLLCSNEVGDTGRMEDVDDSLFATNYYAHCSELYSDIYPKTAIFIHNHLNSYLTECEWIIRTNLTTTWNYCKLINTLTLESRNSGVFEPIFLHDHNYTLSYHIRIPKCPWGYALVINRHAWHSIHLNLLPCIASPCSHALLDSLNLSFVRDACLRDGYALQQLDPGSKTRLVDDLLICLLLNSKGITSRPGFHLMCIEKWDDDISRVCDYDVIRIKFPGHMQQLIKTRLHVDALLNA